jgi:hypothetical protein
MRTAFPVHAWTGTAVRLQRGAPASCGHKIGGGRGTERLRGAASGSTARCSTTHFMRPDQDGNSVRLSDLEGQTVVLYFYPNTLR